MSAHKKRGLFGLFKKKGEKEENEKAEKESTMHQRSSVSISAATANKEAKKGRSNTDRDVACNSAIPNGVLPNSDSKTNQQKEEHHSSDATVQLSEESKEIKSTKEKQVRVNEKQKQESAGSTNQKSNTTTESKEAADVPAKGRSTTDISSAKGLTLNDSTTKCLAVTDMATRNSTSLTAVNVMAHQSSDGTNKAIKGPKEEVQDNAVSTIKHEQQTNAGQKMESMESIESYEAPSTPEEHSPIPSDPSLTPRAASDNQSESTIDDSKTMLEEAEQTPEVPITVNQNDLPPSDSKHDPLGNRTSEVTEISKEQRSPGDQHLESLHQSSAESLRNARSALRSVPLASLPHAHIRPSQDADTISVGRNKAFKVGIIHYSPESFAGVKQRNAQFGGLSPPPIKRVSNMNMPTTSVKQHAESKPQLEERIEKMECTNEDGEDPLQKEYARLRTLFEQWQAHCTDPIAIKKAYTLKLQGELIAQLKLVQDLCSKAPPAHLVNHPPLTLPMLPPSHKKRPAIINYKFTPLSPNLPSQPQPPSPHLDESKAFKSSSQWDVTAESNKSSSQKKISTTAATYRPKGRGDVTSVVRPHSYTPLMRNEFSVPRMHESNNHFEPRTIAVTSYKDRPELHTISYVAAPSKQTDLCAVSDAGKDWNRSAGGHEIDEKGWITSTLRLGSSTKKDEQKEEKDSAFQRIQREIEIEAQRQRELKRMHQQLNKVTTIQEVDETEQQHPLKQDLQGGNLAQTSTKQISKTPIKCAQTKSTEKPQPNSLIRCAYTSTANQPKRTIADEKVQAQISATPIQDGSITAIKRGTVSAISRNLEHVSSQETSKVPLPRPGSNNSIKQVLQDVKLSAQSEHSNTASSTAGGAPTSKLDVAHRHGAHISNQTSRSSPASNSRPTSTSSTSMTKSNPSTTAADSAEVDHAKNDAHRPITTNIRSVISSAKNAHPHIENSNAASNEIKREKNTHNEGVYGSEAQQRKQDNDIEDNDDNHTNTSIEGNQFVIPPLRKVGMPVERVGIQLGFVREDKGDAEKSVQAGTSASSSSMPTVPDESSGKSSVSNAAESTNSVTVCTPLAPPPPPPGPAPVIAELRSPRSECSLTQWVPPTSLGMSQDSRLSSNASLQTPGIESVDDKKERFRKSLSPYAAIDPAILMAEMKKVQLKPATPVCLIKCRLICLPFLV
ncbi:unnamed protein product [Toxocara canis]|uniref:WH2 domain-containing protein n=1 Tax=Toxocara canis TaxID=6265 RepID=A0A183V7Q0_TOXCA|nr:unnamed protein product [Toxocara canis]